MREILFRGKHSDNKWYYGSLTVGNNQKVYISSCGEAFPIEVYPETVGQYTGLTDKNGERIWEGDIVRCKQERNNEGICVVRWFNGAFVACSISGNLLEMTLHDYWYNDYDLVEIIGNETDNPELLKGE